jgi:pyruvate kinase
MSERAECVMLNKGPFVLQAIDVFTDVLNRMTAHQHKKMAQSRALHRRGPLCRQPIVRRLPL